MEKDELLAGMIQELRRGSLTLCVLSQLRCPAYGYQLITLLNQNGIPVEANTLYPLLRRLENQGLLQSFWDTQESKPRKYYSVTATGQEIYDTLHRYWIESAQAITRLLSPDPTQ